MTRSQRSPAVAAHLPPQPGHQRMARSGKQAYDEALLSEWIMISTYSPEDFLGRFGWPEMSLEAGRHFALNVA